MTQPLADIRVCDLTQNLAGPFCCQILGDFGADVIKVEPPAGDTARPWGPPFWGEESALFLTANRGKRSVILDLKQDRGREVLHRIAASSDVVVQASRLGVAERLGFDYETLKTLREDLIHMSITAYGRRGPLSGEPGYDPLIQAFSGIMSVTGNADAAPARVGGSVVDFGTGMWAALAILAALRTRDTTGKGARLETALLDTALQWVSYHILGYLATGEVPGPMGSGLVSIAPYEAFPTSDGSVMVAAGNDAIFRRLCDALGMPEAATDERFLTNPSRVANREVLTSLVADRTTRLSTERLLTLARDYGVPCSPIQDMAQVVRHPQVMAADLLHSAPRADAPDYQDLGLPLRVDGARPRGTATPPSAGEHTLEILRDVGYEPSEIEDLLDSRAVATEIGSAE